MKHHLQILPILSFFFFSCSMGKVEVPTGQEKSQEELFCVQFPSPDSEIPSVVLTSEEKAMVSATNGFAFSALRGLYGSHEEKSFVFSPLSLQYALGMLANGVSKADADEICSVLGYRDDLSELNAFSKSLIEQIPAVDLDVELALANAMIVNEDYPVLPSYKQKIAQYYYSSVENLPFSDEEYVKSVVNDWCYKNTRGLIPALLDQVEPGSAAYLLNALYFKGMWTNPYPDYQVVKDAVFHGLNGEEPADFLFDCSDYDYAERAGFRLARKPFGEGKYGFYILLPDEDSDVNAVLEAMAGAEWEGIDSSLKNRLVSMRIPKFELSSVFSLIKQLEALGIHRVFGSSADFSGMLENPQGIGIGAVIQKSRISVDEGGVEAAAVSEIELLASDGPPGEDDDKEKPVMFWADRPFVFVIAEKTSGSILFSGVYSGALK